MRTKRKLLPSWVSAGFAGKERGALTPTQRGRVGAISEVTQYPAGSVTDPQGAVTGSIRVVRGGAWDDGAGGCRSANRFYGGPGVRGIYVGFRVVLAPGQ